MIYKEDIAMMNDNVLYKDTSIVNKKVVKTLTGLSLLVPLPSDSAVEKYFSTEFKTELLYETYPDTPVIDQKDIETKVIPEAILNRLSEIGDLKDNWDGYGAIAVPAQIKNNAEKFLSLLSRLQVEITEADDIYPTPYGTIVIEYNNERGLVSMEISQNQIGFFTDYPGCGNFGSKGIDTSFTEIPDQLKQHIQS